MDQFSLEFCFPSVQSANEWLPGGHYFLRIPWNRHGAFLSITISIAIILLVFITNATTATTAASSITTTINTIIAIITITTITITYY